ncbi:MAG: flagellar hook-basal body complex protein FliE [Beijerinckiaceae bacterium]|jgi:flagellar hook-basal body complex protein FliE|nr:flagellar hook-basal body complex protein FliE [Beijerinckiaceae bacterium]MDO9441299.1 flagellar hook-basal body complex protein FliE [Beijerinckiaceae bacterium]
MIDSISMLASTKTAGVPLTSAVGAASGAPVGGADFGKILADVASGAVDTMKGGEAASIAGLKGKMPLQDVVEAVMSAERTFQTALALRDKAVGAYQEISRMAI